MNKKIIESLLTELNVTPKENSQLNEFLVRLDAKDNADGVSNERFSEASINLESSTSTETDQIIFGHLKRLQTIRFSRLILDLAIKAESLSDLKEAQASGVEKIIDLPDSTTAKFSPVFSPEFAKVHFGEVFTGLNVTTKSMLQQIEVFTRDKRSN